MLRYLIFLFIITSCQAQEKTVFTKLHENIYAINDQYFYGEHVHTYVIDLDNKLLLVDLPTYSSAVKAFILSFDKPVYAILSHGSCGIADGTRWQEEIGLRVYAHKQDETHPWIRMKPDVLFNEVPTFDESIEVIHTPGHSAGSICVLDQQTKSLFTGDTFYAGAQGDVRDFTQENQAAYENLDHRIESCRRLLTYDFEHVYPFHYHRMTGDAKQRLEQFLADK